MKISIITVCWNSEKFISDAMQSVLDQDYTDIEYIIVDGASTDRTLEHIRKYQSKFGDRMKWISEKDKGIYDAMNKGIQMSSGEVIGILNSDDFYVDNKVISKVMSIFKNTRVDGVYANLFYVDPETLKIKRKWITGLQRSFSSGWHPAHPTFFVTKECYNRFGLFDTSLPIAADFELMLRFVEKNKIKLSYFSEFILKMRLGGESNKSIKNILKGNREILQAFKKNKIPYGIGYTPKRWISKIIQYF
ncbi:MAG: glycosyltransferase [Kaistella sp.]|nr:glycosyltransferase [Kaistella sp.]